MKLKKRKYNGRCDSYVLYESPPKFEGMPIFGKYDMTKNGAFHLKEQSMFIMDRWIDDSNESYSFKCVNKT